MTDWGGYSQILINNNLFVPDKNKTHCLFHGMCVFRHIFNTSVIKNPAYIINCCTLFVDMLASKVNRQMLCEEND